MKKSLLLIALITATLGIQAQQKSIDRLFPDFAKDQQRAKALTNKHAQLPKEAKATQQEIESMIFPGSKLPGNAASISRKSFAPAPAAAKTQQLPSAVTAEEATKNNEANNAAALKKAALPPPEQGEEPAPAKTTTPVKQPASRNVNVKKQ
ncbi:hypothetical protein [Chitinophaga defluvii]|uniref:Uncharacterized protein n=1 Tax=Chitinophaga defluvii TaxID=3163343 RepID=A0ABV2TBX9_9BACT